MSKWIKIKDQRPVGNVLVYLESELLTSRIHSATYSDNLVFVGGLFEWDAPKVTHWMEHPEEPEEDNE